LLEEERVTTTTTTLATGGGGGGYRTVMTLVIRDFRPAQDKGAYVCRAANSLGDAESSIQVYGSFHFILTQVNRYTNTPPLCCAAAQPM
jgi:hypothetical protein